ncbi:Thioredoxin-like fold [Pseudocohnilembus persalinus]|uniref:Palmitoyltransferase n=1 Tax=Pseudocohnilembus persalinus TaxID=266149 RepID=A0A0V0QUJ1_PSEPJ|nr:Thioredoxin-like fold [Pseudocohnilembus persalinus]|eukprot:KRX05905.1 Thioredoxin-like fold [Pseudocohnilembus persalinus]
MAAGIMKQLNRYIYVIFILALLFILYFINIYLIWFQRFERGLFFYVYVVIFNILFFLLLWSMAQTMWTDPGKVPLYWGYFLDENENKKKRYCLICHIFKPERCHHCSACNRCVLNMDHHCPWITNCVGFNNRKFFILMLTYIMICDILAVFPMCYESYKIIEKIDQFFHGDDVEIYWFSNLLIICGTLLALAAVFVIGNFYKFHLTLVFNNSSTIENLDRKRQGSKSTGNQTNYDMGYYYNFVQVFGKDPIIWPFPFFTEMGKPVGDGVLWPQRYQEIEIDDDLENRTLNTRNNTVSNNNNNVNGSNNRQLINSHAANQNQMNSNSKIKNNNNHMVTSNNNQNMSDQSKFYQQSGTQPQNRFMQQQNNQNFTLNSQNYGYNSNSQFNSQHNGQVGYNSQLRNYVAKNYWNLKTQNPQFPFLVRECENTEPYIIARYDYGIEKKAFVAGVNEQEIDDVLKNLVDQASNVNKNL